MTLAVVASLETLLNLKLPTRWIHTSAVHRQIVNCWRKASAILCRVLLRHACDFSDCTEFSQCDQWPKDQGRYDFPWHFTDCGNFIFLTPLLNVVPLSALAAILLLTGYKLAQPKLLIQLYQKGWKQFLPFIVTVIAIMLTDLLIGIMIGLVLSTLFILHSNMHSGVKVIHEKHLHGSLTRIELAQNVSFLNRVALLSVLNKIKRHETVVIDASNTAYIDPDLYQVIQEFQQEKAAQRQIDLKLVGFQAHYPELHEDDAIDVDVSTREMQQQLTPELVLQKLKEGNQRFVSQQRLQHDIARQIQITAKYGQHPIAAVWVVWIHVRQPKCCSMLGWRICLVYELRAILQGKKF